MRQYVIYTRVSTKDQGRSGLGLEAQQRDIKLFLNNYSEVPWEIVGEYQDVQSGGDDDRPQLRTALEQCRRVGAELLVAKLDRLSRKVSFIAQLMDDPKLRLRVATMPQADKFQLHIYAALAEQERDFISARTKAALKAAKARGKALGGLRDATMKRNVAIQHKAALEAARLLQVIAPMRDAGKTLASIADALDNMQIATSRGGKWTAKQVSRVIGRGGPAIPPSLSPRAPDDKS
ncbi:resolvase [Youhaiella tibetensis]|uniref:DNA invertase n=1 Tax=Paradevosia tibetensis TaxID=1447062 RepID=A0A5B9DK40_9HYPH|nr:recombinase family protein [Youhaiella tibetensis]QEE19416.1 DNA invertase [Youhaiella tibetensis]GGF33389.1 resolvase [Youhaiella tibetensis]